MSKRLLTLLFLTLPATVAAQSVTWTIDPGHSAAQFSVRHMVVASVRGEFNGPVGTIAFDPKDIAGTLKVDATIDAKSINTRNPDRDKDLKSDLFFDVNKYPKIAFKSKRAEAAGAGHFKVTGDLTMHGATKEVVLDVEGPTPPIKDIWGAVRVGATATTTFDRRSFGLTYNQLLEGGGAIVGNDVHITIDLEFSHK